MDTWQPNTIIYPDAELACIEATRMLGLDVDDIDRIRPDHPTTAIVWNRVGGRDPNALMQCRVYAQTPKAVTDLARELASRMRLFPALGVGVVAVDQNEGPTDMGSPPPEQMRQMMYDITLKPEKTL